MTLDPYLCLWGGDIFGISSRFGSPNLDRWVSDSIKFCCYTEFNTLPSNRFSSSSNADIPRIISTLQSALLVYLSHRTHTSFRIVLKGYSIFFTVPKKNGVQEGNTGFKIPEQLYSSQILKIGNPLDLSSTPIQ